MSLQETALQIAKRFSLKVLPVNPATKAPAFGLSYTDSTNEIEAIAAWRWNGHAIGIRPNSGFIVFDADRDIEQAESLLKSNLGSPAAIVESRREGGLHFWYRFKGQEFQNGKWACGDIRCSNGYIIAWHPQELINQLTRGQGEAIRPEQVTALLAGKENGRGGKSLTGYEKGNRHNQLIRDCWRAGYKGDENKLARAKQQAMDAGLDREDIERSSKDAWRAGQNFDPTELGVTSNWVNLHGQDFRYIVTSPSQAKWAMWKGTHWQPANRVEVYESLRDFVQKLPIKKGTRPMRKGSFISGCEQNARGQCKTYLQEFDADPLQLNTPGGVLDLNTGKMLPHDRAQRFLKLAGATPDLNAPCPLWDAALDTWTQGNTELQTLLQVIAGLCLRGDNIEQVFCILHGGGQNGKSVWLDTLCKAMGDYSKTASSTVFKQTRHDQHPAELAALEGMRLIGIPELDVNMTLNESLLKRFTGDELISARGMRQDPRSFRPIGIPILACNQLPRVRDVGVSMQRRAILIPFNAQIKNRDSGLSRKLESELPAILAWAARGHLKYLESGLHVPLLIQNENAAYFANLDVLGRFLGECVYLDASSEISVTDLYRAYSDWVKEQGEYYTETQHKFSSEIARRYPNVEKIRKSDSRYYWRGMGRKL